MAINSIRGNWILTGAIIGAFFVIPGYSKSDRNDDRARSARSTPLLPEPLEVRVPEISFARLYSQLDYRNPFPKTLSVCPSMRVSNAPPTDAGLEITGYRRLVTVNDVKIAIAPMKAGCLSSGFGIRAERLHKGLDYHYREPVEIYAAADGIVRERKYRDDYGNMLVLEHGSGVFTRYAHLQSFADGVEIGATLNLGETIGLMGNTASYRIPIHLHYEVLVGEWGDQAGSFALTPVNVLAKLSEN